jgi:hypothetical protein
MGKGIGHTETDAFFWRGDFYVFIALVGGVETGGRVDSAEGCADNSRGNWPRGP